MNINSGISQYTFYILSSPDKCSTQTPGEKRFSLKSLRSTNRTILRLQD